MAANGPIKALGAIRRKPIDLSSFNPIRESRLELDQPLPLILQPAAGEVDLAEWAASNRDYIDQKLSEHGAILFRGFGLHDAKDFARVARSICRELYDDYGDLPRENIAEKVYTSTPYPPDKMILYHNESSHMGSWPSKINFFCVMPAQAGGMTPLVDCRKVYKTLDPIVREKFERVGLTYVRNFCEGLDVSWQRFFGTNDRAAVEKTCRDAGTTCEWTTGDGLRISQRCQAVLRHPRTGEASFFNQVQLHHVHCLDPEVRQSLLCLFPANNLPRQVYYGDGSVIEDSVMDHVGEIYERYAVRSSWQSGDMITLDNMLTAHARDPYVGPRKIVVALGDMVTAEGLSSARRRHSDGKSDH